MLRLNTLVIFKSKHYFKSYSKLPAAIFFSGAVKMQHCNNSKLVINCDKYYFILYNEGLYRMCDVINIFTQMCNTMLAICLRAIRVHSSLKCHRVMFTATISNRKKTFFYLKTQILSLNEIHY